MDDQHDMKKIGYSFRAIALLAFIAMGCSEKKGTIAEKPEGIYAADSIESCHDNIPSRFGAIKKIAEEKPDSLSVPPVLR